MSGSGTEIEREALTWLLQVNDPEFAAWDAWEAWMAADPRHAEAYWRLAEPEADIVEALKTAPVPVAPVLSRRRFALPRRSAIAAAFALVVAGVGWVAWNEQTQPWTIETAPGQSRVVMLADGSRVSLDGATRLTLDRRDQRDVTLDAGRALFEVVHDETRPFRVEVGETALIDLGTTFDVTRLGDGARVAVSEGRVRVDRGGASATLGPGDGVLVTARGLARRPVPVADVAGWKSGRLSYTDESLAVVAQDLERALGRPVRVAPALSGRRFSGSLTTRAAPADLRPRLARLLGVSIVEDGDGWRLEP